VSSDLSGIAPLASTVGHGSDIDISADGTEIAKRNVKIACGGSLLLRTNEIFSADERKAGGDNGYVVVRDVTCRLFGYHGVLGPRAFSLDHMFGF
jgi:hypothetical protein